MTINRTTYILLCGVVIGIGAILLWQGSSIVGAALVILALLLIIGRA